ncbi:MAG: 16S rRNA (uracil(1498)-N(3))-methyltransferase [Oscillospiraceae bacterium]|nr:16S rRNA (uracil(1498)-N(3))-methyltransferase [Oscillospiraceae bacterium]
MPHRYFTTDITGDTARLHGQDAHHLARVMRAKLGEEVILCDGNAVEYTATITGFEKDSVEFSVSPGYPSVAEPTVKATLFVGYPKQGKLETIVQKAVELGAVSVVPFFSRYCVATPKKEDEKNGRYNRVAAEAAGQCGRGILPTVEMPLNIKDLPARFAEFDKVLFFYEGGGQPLKDACQGAKNIALITGSEGGFAPEEAELLKAAGAQVIGLGPRILRCETAPAAALAAVMAFTGNLE